MLMLALRLEGHACVRCYLSVLSCKLASPTTETNLLSIKRDQRVFGLKKSLQRRYGEHAHKPSGHNHSDQVFRKQPSDSQKTEQQD